jgi:hypothetical protein
MQFNFDWWFESGYRERLDEARNRCAANRFPQVDAAKRDTDKDYQQFLKQIEVRTILYLKDGFSYEIKELLTTKSTQCLTFECMPSDEAYKVGCFIVTVPFDDVVRVEVFAVHPTEKPEEMMAIKGFAGSQAPGSPKRTEDRSTRSEGS